MNYKKICIECGDKIEIIYQERTICYICRKGMPEPFAIKRKDRNSYLHKDLLTQAVNSGCKTMAELALFLKMHHTLMGESR